jgi:predicted NAD/FAD-binding protein
MNQNPDRPRIAVIGAGIAGLSTAWLLRAQADVTLFEAEPRAGGHADTQLVELGGRPVAVDTGFIVYNTLNYPNLTGLFAHLGVATTATDMSFGVSIGGGRLEYAGGELAQMFAQRRNAVRPRFWGMVRDIMRFYREAPALLHSDGEESLGEWLARRKYGRAFTEDHILPMGAAIWSASVEGMRAFPARHFARFFHNHGLLRLTERPAWRTVTGGSRNYVARMLADLATVRLGCAVQAVRRHPDGVELQLPDGSVAHFDQVVLACHADQALAMIEAPSPAERAVLGAIRCQENHAVLHTDVSLMPRRRGVWSAWNYLADGADDHVRKVSVTYWMNRLQGLQTAEPLLVSLNPIRPPDPRRVLLERSYRHPQFDAAAMAAQAALPSIQGRDRLWFAGAWTAWGFHEDGIAAAVRVAAGLGVTPPWAAAADRVAA